MCIIQIYIFIVITCSSIDGEIVGVFPLFRGSPAPAVPPEAVRVRFEDSDPALEPLPLDGDDGELEKKFSKLLKTLRERLLARTECNGKTVRWQKSTLIHLSKCSAMARTECKAVKKQ